MRSEQNLLAEHPHVTFARSLANLTEAHATDLLVNLGQIMSMEHVEQLHEARITAKRLRYLLEPVRAYARRSAVSREAEQAAAGRARRLERRSCAHARDRPIVRGFDAAEGRRVRDSLRRGDIERARREASVSEWAGLVELYDRLDKERRELIARVRDRWLGGDLDTLVAKARDLAQDLRTPANRTPERQRPGSPFPNRTLQVDRGG